MVSTILLASAWLLLGLTVLPIVSVAGNLWVVKWAAWPEGQASPGSVALAANSVDSTDLSSRLTLITTPDETRRVVQVIAGPGGEVRAGPDLQVYFNGISTGVYSTAPFESKPLGDNYLAVCLSGVDCQAGIFEFVPVGNILGQVVGSLRFPPGLNPPPDLWTTPQNFPSLPSPPISSESPSPSPSTPEKGEKGAKSEGTGD